MSDELVMIGHKNFVPIKKIIAILNRETRSMVPILKKSEIEEKLIDATKGRKTRSVILTENDYCILSSLSPEVIAQRIEKEKYKTLNAGNNNFILSRKVQSIIRIDSAPMRRLLETKRKNNKVISLSSDKKTKSGILIDEGYIFLSQFETNTLRNRY